MQKQIAVGGQVFGLERGRLWGAYGTGRWSRKGLATQQEIVRRVSAAPGKLMVATSIILLPPIVLFALGWTGLWISGRRNGRPVLPYPRGRKALWLA